MQSDHPGQYPAGQYPAGQYPAGQYPAEQYPPQGLTPFTSEERELVGSVARLAMIGAWLSIVGTVVGLGVSFYQMVKTPGAGPGNMFSGLVGAGIAIALAALLLSASNKLADFAKAETPNVWDLVGGIEGLRVYFKVMGVLVIIVMVIMGLGILLVMCMVAAGAG